MLINEGILGGLSEMGGMLGHEVGQIAPLGVVPNMFGWIEFGRVGRQPFGPQPSRVLFVEQTDRFAMHSPAIQDDDQRTAQLPIQVAQKTAHVLGLDVVIEELEVQVQSQGPGSDGQGSDYAPAVVAVPAVQHGRLAPWRPRATHQRLQHQARFVEKHQASFSFEPLFLVAARSRDAKWRWNLRPAPEHDAQASEDSNPACATACRHSRCDRPRQSAFGSPGPRVHTSTVPWQSHCDERRGRESLEVADADEPRAARDDLTLAWPTTRPLPWQPPRRANVEHSNDWLPPAWPRPSPCHPRLTAPRPCAAEPPTEQSCHEVSSCQPNNLAAK